MKRGKYKIFIRNWWRMEKRQLVPDPSARWTTYNYADTEEEARAICKQYSDTHKPGKLSRKAEYTSNW